MTMDSMGMPTQAVCDRVPQTKSAREYSRALLVFSPAPEKRWLLSGTRGHELSSFSVLRLAGSRTQSELHFSSPLPVALSKHPSACYDLRKKSDVEHYYP